MRKVLFVISVILFILILRLALKGVGNVELPFTDYIEKSEPRKKDIKSVFSIFPSKIIESRAHICFQGTTLNGILSDVVYKLENKGYDLLVEDRNTAKLTGTLLGYTNTTIYVESCPVCLEVYRVTACLPTQTHWSGLYKDYKNFKAMLTERHGKPIHSTERFDRPVALTDDRQCETALKNNEVHLLSIYRVQGGRVELSICNCSVDDKNSFRVIIRYIDDENYEDRGKCMKKR